MRFFTTEKLSQKMAKTPEGFLLCLDVPLARTGAQVYGPDETPLDVGEDGMVTVERPENEVFRPETIASFAGKPVVNEHPQHNGERVDVTPENWRDYAMGVVLDPRRGKGQYDDCLIGDLLVTDLTLIDLIRSGKREVSCGYNADYIAFGPGKGQQRNIVGNHVALVDQGRCGPRCSIHDHSPEGVKAMAKITCDDKMKAARDKVLAAFKARDEKALDAALNEIGQTETPDPGASGGNKLFTDEELEKRFGSIGQRCDSLDAGIKSIHKHLGIQTTGDEPNPFAGKETPEEEAAEKEEMQGDAGKELLANLKEEAPPGTGDRAVKARDSAFLADSFQDTISLAEILVPGIRPPTFDKAAQPKTSFDALCQFRRRVIDAAYSDHATREIIDEVLAGKTLDTKTMSCADARSLLRTAGIMKRRINNAGGFHVGEKTADVGTGGGLGVAGAIKTPAQLNARNADYWQKQRA